jgi:uncharacterized protein
MAELRCFKVGKGEEVLETLGKQFADAGIRNGAIVSLIGAIDSCRISNMPADDASTDIVTEYRQPLELSGTGEIVDGSVHIHVSLGREGDAALAGHLHSAEVGAWYVAAYVLSSDA